MPQSLAQMYLHLVFSTKDRRPLLSDKRLRTRIHAYLAGTCKNLQAASLQVGGVEDHVHICCRLAKTLAVADLVKELKRESSKWLKTQDRSLRRFYWQSGYGAFSVSPSHVDPLVEYIKNQGDHHKKETFQDECRRLCEKYGVELNERYVWD